MWCPSLRSDGNRPVLQDAYVDVIGWLLLGWTEGPTVTVPPRVLALAPVLALITAGCSGADGFFKCVVTKSAEPTVAPTVTKVAAAFRRKSRNLQTATGALRNGTWSKDAPKILVESAPR